jgi:protein arginine N-methyltransferase 1
MTFVDPGLVDEHFRYLSDPIRMAAYTRAIERVVRPGDRVLDLGSGTGILGLLACRAGARRVYAVDEGRMLELAREEFRANGFEDRAVFIRGHSRRVALPERVDVVLADQIGTFGVDAGLLEYFADARARFLEPKGRMVPERLDLHVAPVESRAAWEKIGFWERSPAGFDFSPARRAAAHAVQPLAFCREELLAASTLVRSITLGEPPTSLALEATFSTERKGTLHGLAGWFTAQLAPGVYLTNAPGAPDAMDRRSAFFPVGEAVAVEAGTKIHATWQLRLPDVASWTCHVGGRRFSQTNLLAVPLGAEDIRKQDPKHRPRLSPRGEARRHALELCDGGRALSEIEDELVRSHGSVLGSREEVAAFLAALVERDCD